MPSAVAVISPSSIRAAMAPVPEMSTVPHGSAVPAA